MSDEIIHIIPAQPVFASMTEFWVNHFQEFNPKVILFKNKCDNNTYVFSNRNITILEYSGNTDLTTLILQVLNRSQFVYLHSSFFPLLTKWMLLMRGIGKHYNKIAWIEWGFDIYYKDNSSWIRCLISSLKKLTVNFFERKIPYFIAIHPADIKSYHRNIKGRAYIFEAPYVTKKGFPDEIVKFKKTLIQEKSNNNEPIIIQVGHRADHILNHKETLDWISRFANENILIYLPLCYGDAEYGKKIAKYARKLFGEKAIIQEDIISYECYLKQLGLVDIFILNSYRQIALGNLNPMIVMEKKIVLPKASVLYDYLTPFAPIFPYENLRNCSFEEFINDVDMQEARMQMLEYRNVDPIDSWHAIFHEISCIRHENVGNDK